MKIALILVLFSSSVIGVFADTDKVESVSVSVMEGDSVTLHTGVTKIQGSDEIEWRFNGIRMATIDSDSPSTEGPFRDTMQLNNTTGDLKITDVTTTDSGLYKLQITSGSGSPEIIFSVTVVISSGVKSASVTEGDSVTLRSGVNGLQRDDVIRWRHQNILIAEIINETPSIYTYNSESLKLDKQTGSLTITDIKTEHAGDYEVDVTISSSRYTIHKSFSVNINDEQKSVSVMEGDSVTLISGLTEIQRDDEIRWSFKNNSIAYHRFSTDDDDLDERFRDRLKLDEKTGSLTITNIRNRDSGEYEVEISTNRFIVHKRISITVNDEQKSVSVMEGDSFTLISGLTEIQRDDEIRWSFKKTTIITTTDDDVPEGRFRDRLKLDHQTGSLTITNTRNRDSGEYQVEISTNRFTIHRRINVTINEAVNLVSVKEGDSVTLHTNASISRNDAVLWYGDKGVRITPLTGPVDPRWKNTDQNDRTGDLTIRNIRRDQSGDYKVFININGVSKQKKFHINITDLSPVVPDSGLSSGAIAGIVVGVLPVVFAAAGVIYSRHKRSKPEISREENGQNHTSNKDEATELTKPVET